MSKTSCHSSKARLEVTMISQELGQVALLPVIIPITIFGKVITGLAIGRGSTYLHDLIGKWFKNPTLPEEQPQPS
ncbi:MAG: hypothetical protein MUO76_10670 [Anaerolineaceae bacterium]|nr:hypothetical protein [Anaerolineaceae bacterium]